MECDKPECSFVKPSKDHSRCICAEDFPIALCDICIRYFTSNLLSIPLSIEQYDILTEIT